jgi:MFS family permease
VLAAQHASALLLAVACASVVVGVLSDRLGKRRGIMRAGTLLYALSWLPWLLHVQWPPAVTLAWFAFMGLLVPGFTLSWAVAKEVNRPEHSGMATAVVNLGVFLGAGILQPMVGYALDQGRAAGFAARAWDSGLWWLAGSAAFGAAAAWFVGERRRG